MQLAHTDLSLANVAGRETLLSRQLHKIRSRYDFILCDCPPSLSMLPVNALVAADRFIVPVTPEYLALEGLVSLMNAVDQMKAGMGISPELLGIVFTLSNSRLNLSRRIIDLVREQFGSSVFETRIRRDIKLSEAPSYGKSIFDFAPGSQGAGAYTALAAEVLERCKAKTPETASVPSS
jgi:chromosome partitioning protein